jgi:mannosyltransferase OCH1-like enzyme
MIPRKLHLIWVGGSLAPDYVQANFNMWKQLMPEWDCKLWVDDDITSDVFPVDLVHSATKGAQKADIMRYFILEKFGGVYMDTDVTPYKSLEPIVHMGDFVSCHDMEITWKYIAIGFIASVPHHHIIAEICDRCHTATLNTADIHMQTGPRLFGDVVMQYHTEVVFLTSEHFYRNMKGEIWLDDGSIRSEDIEHRFGNHFYAKCW